MKFVVEIACDNAAFGEDKYEEVARILREAATTLMAGGEDFKLRDFNGNTVGSAKFVTTRRSARRK